MEHLIQYAVWLFPAAVAAHFYEESPSFADWARRNISRRYTRAHWRRVHAAGFGFAILLAGLVSAYPEPWSVFLLLALGLTPAVANMLFHFTASIYYRDLSPGFTSAALLYPALFAYFAHFALRAGLIGGHSLAAAVALGGLFHLADLASTTFFVPLHFPRAMSIARAGMAMAPANANRNDSRRAKNAPVAE